MPSSMLSFSFSTSFLRRIKLNIVNMAMFKVLKPLREIEFRTTHYRAIFNHITKCVIYKVSSIASTRRDTIQPLWFAV